MQYAIKILLTAVVAVAVSELGKRSTFWGALLVSLPLTSLLAFVWVYTDTGSEQLVAGLSFSIFWMALASLPLFLVLPALIRAGVTFWPALGLSCLLTAGVYLATIRTLAWLGVRL